MRSHRERVRQRDGKGAARPSPSISPSRKRLYLAIISAIPLCFFLLLEMTLRLAHYGPDLALFTKETLNGRDYLTLNPEAQARYFSRHVFNPTHAPAYFRSPKPPGTYRIFCLGGSTTAGYPYWYNGAFPAFLKDRLKSIFPKKSVEVVNLGLVATNSFTVNDMASDIFRQEPDLIIVYDGHNEFYGAMGIASHESLGSVRWLTKLTLRLIHLRTFFLLRDLFARAAALFQPAPSNEAQHPLMEILASGQYIPYGSSTYKAGLRIFRENLAELRDLAAAHRVPVIVGSQVSNLRDQQPFVSADDPSITAEARSRYHRLFDEGSAFRSQGKFPVAIEDFRRALAADSLHADCHYALARCLDTLGDRIEARREYLKARDFDQLRFRASTDFNRAIRAAADGRWMFFADMESTFAAHSTGGLIGTSLILEHLHPNSAGNFLLAETYAAVMRAHGMLATADEWQADDTIPDSLLWKARSVTPLDELVAQRRTEVLLSGWPFRNQVPIVEAIPPTDTLRTIAEQITRRTRSWRQAHQSAAAYYRSRHELEAAANEYRVMIDQQPMLDVRDYLELGQLLLLQKRTREFGDVLKASLEVKPTISAYRALGDLAMDAGDAAGAVGYYEKMADFEQSVTEKVVNGYALALAYDRADRPEEAVTQVLKILALRPSYQPALQLLQKIKGKPTAGSNPR